MPGFGTAENQRTQSIQDLATTMAVAVEALGLTQINLMGTSFGGAVACWMAVQRQDLVAALVLEAPSGIRPEGSEPVSGSPEEVARMLYAHPERIPPAPAVEPALAARRLALVRRVRGPARDAGVGGGVRGVGMPGPGLFWPQNVGGPPAIRPGFKG